MAEFVLNNKTYSATKVSSFITNYSRELRMKVDIRRKEKVENTMDFVERIKKMQKETEIVLRKA